MVTKLFVMVALNSSVCRLEGRAVAMTTSSDSKLGSRSLSASSNTRNLTRPKHFARSASLCSRSCQTSAGSEMDSHLQHSISQTGTYMTKTSVPTHSDNDKPESWDNVSISDHRSIVLRNLFLLSSCREGHVGELLLRGVSDTNTSSAKRVSLSSVQEWPPLREAVLPELLPAAACPNLQWPPHPAGPPQLSCKYGWQWHMPEGMSD